MRYANADRDRPSIAAPVENPHHTVQPQQWRAAVTRVVDTRAQPGQRRPQHQRRELVAQPRGERAPQLSDDKLGNTFGGLDHNVARETVRDDDIGNVAREILPLDVADEANPRQRRQPLVSLARKLVALAGLFTNVEQADAWLGDAQHAAGVIAPEHRILLQKRRPGIGRGSYIENQHWS